MCPTPQRFHTVLHFEYSRGDNNFNFSSWLGYVNMSFRDLMKYYLFGIYLVPKLRQARLARQQDAGVAPAILLQHRTASGKPMRLPALCIIFGIVYNISECGGQVSGYTTSGHGHGQGSRVAVTCTGPHQRMWGEMSCKSAQSKLFAAYNFVFNFHL